MNLKELSDILGISQTTISRALNGYPEVNKNTKKRVEEAALRYGYRPSSVARRLAGKNVEAVGVIYPFDESLRSSPVFLEMVRTLSSCLRQEKIDLFVIPGNSKEEIALYERMYTGGRVDSFIVVATRRNDERIKWLLDKNIPFVSYGRSDIDREYSWCDVDNRDGVVKATEKLIQLGHKRIAFINPSDDFYFAWERKQGFLNAVNGHSGSIDAPIVIEANLEENAGYNAAKELLSVNEEQRPSAIICSSMLNAKGILNALNELNLIVGKDISVIAWDDDVSDIKISGMSVIKASVGHSGECLGGLMLNILRKNEKEMRRELKNTELILNDSVCSYDGYPI